MSNICKKKIKPAYKYYFVKNVVMEIVVYFHAET